MVRRFLFLLGSTRLDGNTEAMARQAAAYLSPEVEQSWLRLSDLPLPAFEDVRHTGDGTYPEPVGNPKTLLDETLAATDIVIASPLYWYSLSTSVKNYLDHWTGWLRVPGADFKARMGGKTLWGVTALSDADSAKADPLVGTLRYTAEYMGARFGGVLLGHYNFPGQARTEPELPAAKDFFSDRPSIVTTRLASPTRIRISA
ncbi:flavodoxin family protein [Hamadaea tsunoensis]|uniref:flavodoxin family protein n=1 Tax=Hamadaea tsunoensis TaxID=53368 RepID=UPI000413912E|nr:NAD(P)H-dependent oxidoreductase [Hamadaea tsunoensis]